MKFTKLPRKQKNIIVTGLAALLLIAIALTLAFCGKRKSTPTLTVETPPKQSERSGETFSVDVLISDLGEALYPAMSLSVSFDSSRLEFLGIEEGNLMTLGDERADGNSYQLPKWTVNVDRCNKIGRINAMYLDMTGGKYAFTKETMREENNVVMRLQFKLRGSAAKGDVYDLAVEDAVFAASDESQSLSSVAGTLKVQNGKVVVGGAK